MERADEHGGAGFRVDIEGLRGLAVVLVLLGHAGLSAVSGGFVGVDVFFVISGFLITGLLVSELGRTGRISLRGFYLRRIKRLLPAAGVVLLASLLLAYMFVPKTRWTTTAGDVVAAGGYAINWRLALQAADYLRADEAPSIAQHYWSLAVEEQFYLVWPFIMIIAVTVLRGRGEARTNGIGPRLMIAFTLVGVASLGWSIHLTQTEPARAYFVTTTRMWELALGGVVAIATPMLGRLPVAVSALLGWAGIGAVIVAATTFTADVAFPGYLALLPVLGTAGILAAGCGSGGFGPVMVLSLRPVRAVGAVSYSWYLWHWPLLVAARAHWGKLEPWAALVVIICSAIPAVLTSRLVENPIRYSPMPRVRRLRYGLAAMMGPIIAGMAFQIAVRPTPLPTVAPQPAGAAITVDPKLGAAVLGTNPRESPAAVPVDRVDSITPDPQVAYQDISTVYRDGCITEAYESTLHPCVYGDRGSTVEVALVGDSHAAQWVPALQAIAAQRGWRLVTYIKTSCSVATAAIAVQGRADDNCTQWNKNIREAMIGSQRPRVLIISSVTPTPLVGGKVPSPGQVGVDGQATAMADTWTDLSRDGLPVVVIRDTPAFTINVAECVSQHRDSLTVCTRPRDMAIAGGVPQERAAQRAPGIHLIDLNDAICPADRCVAVIGGALVYWDSNHLTATYVRSLAPRLYDAVKKAVTKDLP